MTAINSDALAKLDEPRKYRQHARAKSETTDPDRQFDTTALHANDHGQHTISHSDYIAHCERYDFAFRSITNGDRVLDVGGGVDVPLYHAISKVQSKASAFYAHEGVYVGADYNHLKPISSKWATMVGDTDATSAKGIARCVAAAQERLGSHPEVPFNGFTLVVCLEVLEHMYPDAGRRLLENVRDAMATGGRSCCRRQCTTGVARPAITSTNITSMSWKHSFLTLENSRSNGVWERLQMSATCAAG